MLMCVHHARQLMSFSVPDCCKPHDNRKLLLHLCQKRKEKEKTENCCNIPKPKSGIACRIPFTYVSIHQLCAHSLNLCQCSTSRTKVEAPKVTTPKCDTCFSLGTWEGVVQNFYWQGH
jgi:hypothetical protein